MAARAAWHPACKSCGMRKNSGTFTSPKDYVLFALGAGVGISLACLAVSRRKVSARKALQQTFADASKQVLDRVETGRRAATDALHVASSKIDAHRERIANAADAVAAAVRPR
jgi:tRNA U34 5-methylaminomethyl-2-thiouridine-forming methyltransferase MnmC